MPISDARRANIRVGNLCLNALQACVLLALQDLARREVGTDFGILASAWRRWLASNLEFEEWRRKGWKTQAAYEWLRKCLTELHALAMLPSPRACALTDQGKAAAAALLPRLAGPKPGREFADYCQHTYERVTGRFGD